ncbi:MAG: arylsulfatase [Planctomycetota bacterium]|nr:arylsulfatase [Planctomycetota bacterium]
MKTPNIIYILADDMGYGDMQCNNADSKIPTPNLNRLAAGGMRFTDAHAGSSVCTPSRYSILTGRHCWRSRLKKGIVWEWDAPLIEPDRPTVASFLRDQGYRTACLGKWHLGWDWLTLDGRHPNETLTFGHNDREVREMRNQFGDQIDYTKPISGGPIDRGFDSYFGVDVPNFPPYAWFEDDHLTEVPTEEKPEAMYGNPGQAVADWKLEAMIPEFTRRAVEFIESSAGDENPYFLYFPLTSPHSPIVPNEEFIGKSGCGNYGDFVCEVDWVVGQVMHALDRAGTTENTLLIFTSDNGPENRTRDSIGVYERVREHQHYSMGDLRGIKRDAWEGGHRVPFVASWPAGIPAGLQCDQTVCLSDLIATCADITGASLPQNAGEDSVSMLPLLRGATNEPTRDCIVHHSMSGKFAIREGDWVFIDSPNGGDNEEPDWFRQHRGYVSHDYPGELFNLKDDLSERYNRFHDEPELVEKLSARLSRIKAGEEAQASHATDRELTE